MYSIMKRFISNWYEPDLDEIQNCMKEYAEQALDRAAEVANIEVVDREEMPGGVWAAIWGVDSDSILKVKKELI